MADSLGRIGDLGQATVDAVISTHRGDPKNAAETQRRCRRQLGTAMDEMFGLTPAEVEMMNGLHEDTVAALIDACSKAVNDPNGHVRYERSETGGPRFEFVTRHVSVPRGKGQEHDRHFEVQVHCMK
jgi:hypothetical protein